MKVPIFWHNSFHNKRRTCVALGGITFAMVLVFMQLIFLHTAKVSIVKVYDLFDYDLIITSSRYESLPLAGKFDKTRLFQAKAVAGVANTMVLNYKRVWWRDPENNNHLISCMLFGVGLDPDFFRDESLITSLGNISFKDNLLLDVWSHPDYGEQRIGKRVTLNWKEVTIADMFELGISFHAEGSAMVNQDTFQRVVKRHPRDITFGLIKLAPGFSTDDVKYRLQKVLPTDVLVFERREFIRAEQDYYVKARPLGIMFQAGVFVAFMVGVVILYQILATEIATRLHEFATLKAMGFRRWSIYLIGVQQALLFALMSYLMALPIGYGIAVVIKNISRLPMYLSWEVALLVFLLSMFMCIISGVSALWKVRRAAPADLF